MVGDSLVLAGDAQVLPLLPLCWESTVFLVQGCSFSHRCLLGQCSLSS